MNKLSCNIVRDLLPLYCDMVLEEESVKEVENHLKECAVCQELYEKMNEELWKDGSQYKKKEVPNIYTLFRKIRIRNTIIFGILVIIIFFLSGSYWKVPANAVEIEKISMDTAKYTYPNKEPEYVTYFNVDYRADGMNELDIEVYQEDEMIYIVGTRSLFSIIKNDGYSAQVGGGAGCAIENPEIIEQVYFNGDLIWDVNMDGEIPKN